MTERIVKAANPYTDGRLPARLTVTHLPNGRAIVAIGDWPHKKHAEVEPAALIEALAHQEPAHAG